MGVKYKKCLTCVSPARVVHRIWVSADPNNVHWAKDKNRFGFMMLQKMGWKEGAGLGKNEQGTQDHIKVKQLPTGAGLGVATKEDLSWTVHKVAFEQILSKLSARSSTESDSDSDEASPLKRGMTFEEEDAQRERKRQKKEEKKKLKKELEMQYDALGLTEEEKAERRAADKQQRKAARAAKRQSRTTEDVSRGE